MKNIKLFLSVLWGEIKEPIVALIVIFITFIVASTLAVGVIYLYEEFKWFTSLVDWGFNGLLVLFLIILIIAFIESIANVYKKYKRLK